MNRQIIGYLDELITEEKQYLRASIDCVFAFALFDVDKHYIMDELEKLAKGRGIKAFEKCLDEYELDLNLPDYVKTFFGSSVSAKNPDSPEMQKSFELRNLRARLDYRLSYFRIPYMGPHLIKYYCKKYGWDKRKLMFHKYQRILRMTQKEFCVWLDTKVCKNQIIANRIDTGFQWNDKADYSVLDKTVDKPPHHKFASLYKINTLKVSVNHRISKAMEDRELEYLSKNN